MKHQQRISASQMSLLFFIFLTGATVINIPGPLIGFANNGAWLSLILSASVGSVFVACLLYLHSIYPRLSFIEYSFQLVGKPLTYLFAIPFITLNLYHISGNALDIGLFMNAEMMRETPLFVFLLLVFFVVALTARAGIETFARMAPILIITVVFSILFIVSLASHNYRVEHLLPVFPDGMNPVFLGAYFSYSFPYADIVIFSMLLPFVDRTEHGELKRGMFFAYTLSTILLIVVTLSTIMVFGPMAGERAYSLFAVARTIDLYGVITRIEIFVGYALIVGAFMVDVLTLYILSLVLTHLFDLKSRQMIVFPLALIGFLFSMINLAGGLAQWRAFVNAIQTLTDTLAILPLFILTAVAAWRRQT